MRSTSGWTSRAAQRLRRGAIPAYAASGSTAGGLAGAPLLRVYSAGTDLAPGYPSISTVLVTTTNEAAMGAPAPTTFYVAVFC